MNWKDRVKEFRRVPASELKANPKNWREHPPEQRKALGGVLDEVGIAGALLARETDDGLELIDGHLRTEMDDATEWPVLILDVDEAEADILLATIDPIGALASRNDAVLTDLIASIETDNAALGEMLDAMEKDIPTQIEEGETDPDAIPEGDQVEKRCEPGDLWIMGRHRLLCGDSTSADDMERLLDGAKPALCITDPPYGVNYDASWRQDAAEKGLLNDSGAATIKRRLGKVMNDDRANWSDAWDIIPCDVIYHWSASGNQMIEAASGLLDAGFQIRSQLIWRKTHLPISRGHYRGQHEPCWYAVKKGGTAHWQGDHSQSTVWEVSLDKSVPGGHSTQKPVELFTRAIVNHEGDVLEPFTGSGTCLIACEQTGRICYAMELDTHYCDTILARWEAFTGNKAERA